jgi:outer membrane protein assembly factor BamA
MSRAALLLIAALAIACQTRPPKVPGETDVLVAEVVIAPFDADAKAGKKLALDHGALFERLGQRPSSLINTPRTWSTFREAEDRRRIAAFWQQRGYFDVEVSEAATTFDAQGRAHLRYQVRENERYRVGSVELVSAGEHEAKLRRLVGFDAGTQEIDLEAMRRVRIDMQERLRDECFGHANVYSRFWIDRTAKRVHVRYFVDAGPRTVIASVEVDAGAVKVPREKVLRRAGLKVGEPYCEGLRERVIRDLLDTGAYAAAFVRVDTDTKFIPPGTAPDSGGELRDEQIDANGNLVPRALPAGVNVILHVVEAPSRTFRLRAGFEIDPGRADTLLGAGLTLRNALGALHHLKLDGRVGYGWLFGDGTLDTARRAGVYGDAQIRTVHPGALGRIGDLRTSLRYQGSLFPSAFLHRATAGIGARATLLNGLFLDVELLAYLEKTVGFGPFGDEERAWLALPSHDLAVGPELDVELTWDGRNDPIEPMRGSYASLLVRVDPLSVGAPADQPFVNLAPDVRVFIPLAKPLSIGLRAAGQWSLLAAGDGIPLGARVFGGGSYGFRGRGLQRFSPTIVRCAGEDCANVAVGGRSVFESSLELRLLPPLKPAGGVVFADFGGASGNLNPFALGPSFAAGLGLRLRLWYLPAAVDVAYRVLGEGRVQGIKDAPFTVFFRLGEAF